MVRFSVDDEVSLREFSPEDAQAIFDTVIANSQRLGRFMHWMTAEYSLESVTAFLERAKVQRAEKTGLPLGIFRGDEFIGSIGFVSFDWIAGKTEIGYWIAADEEGKGIVTRAARLLIDFAFRELELNRVEIRCSTENTRSSAVPKRLGFTREGLVRQAEFRNGRLHDFEIFGLLASEWKNS